MPRGRAIQAPDDAGVMHIRFYRWWPGRNCGVVWVIRWPYYIVKAERYDGEIVFDGEYMEDPCKDW